MGDFSHLFSALHAIPQAITAGSQKGLKKGAAVVMGKAKAKLGTYQPAVGPYPAWLKLKPQTVKMKHLTKSGRVSKAGKRYLQAHGSWGEGGNDDSPLVASGHLKQAITTDDSQLDSNKVMYVGVAGGSGTGKGGPGSYAAAQEFGQASKKIPARPYLRPALHESHEDIKECVKNALADALRSAIR